MLKRPAIEFDKDLFKRSVEYNVRTMYRRTMKEATEQQVFQASALALKDQIIDCWMRTQKAFDDQDPKRLVYLSMEFLMGRAFGNDAINLMAYAPIKEALKELGFNMNSIEDQEPDAALGNGGLGRLAACFLDSLATLNYAAYGCGIRYHYGMFKQKIVNGYQKEVPDNWLENGNPLELRRPEYTQEVHFGGYVKSYYNEKLGRTMYKQEGYSAVKAVPYDLPVIGYGNGFVDTLRIWDAQPVETFKLDSFDKGDYQKAVEQEYLAKTICDVLYPNDENYQGKELRLKQQYFFVSASLQSMIQKYLQTHDDIKKLPEKLVFQMNDTHPTLTVPELMRLLMDEYELTWDEAWEVTTKCTAYTNHTIMAEALEKWPIDLFSQLLPRIYSIVEEINRRFEAQIHETYDNTGVNVHEKIRSMDDQTAQNTDKDVLRYMSGGRHMGHDGEEYAADSAGLADAFSNSQIATAMTSESLSGKSKDNFTSVLEKRDDGLLNVDMKSIKSSEQFARADDSMLSKVEGKIGSDKMNEHYKKHMTELSAPGNEQAMLKVSDYKKAKFGKIK